MTARAGNTVRAFVYMALKKQQAPRTIELETKIVYLDGGLVECL
jgi:hypothetical protein